MSAPGRGAYGLYLDGLAEAAEAGDVFCMDLLYAKALACGYDEAKMDGAEKWSDVARMVFGYEAERN